MRLTISWNLLILGFCAMVLSSRSLDQRKVAFLEALESEISEVITRTDSSNIDQRVATIREKLLLVKQWPEYNEWLQTESAYQKDYSRSDWGIFNGVQEDVIHLRFQFDKLSGASRRKGLWLATLWKLNRLLEVAESADFNAQKINESCRFEPNEPLQRLLK